MKTTVVPHDPSWKERYLVESVEINRALGEGTLAFHHIGSTAIPAILAKPVIDVLVEVSQIEEIDRRAACMRELGYELMGEYGIEGRRYFRKSDEQGNRTFHIHVFEQSSPHIERHLLFRDFLLAHPPRAKEYSDLKAAIVAAGVIPMTEYQEAKTSFIRSIQVEAVEWYQNRNE